MRMRGFFRSALVCALIAHLLVIAAMAVNPELHERIHADAGHEDHECAVTLFVHGGCDASAPPLVAIEFVRVAVAAVNFDQGVQVPSCHLTGSILEHAPPANS